MSTNAEEGHVAIIGLAGRFPGAADVETFWENLAAAREGITFASDEELLAAGVRPALLRADGYVKAKGVLPDADLFDAGFFGFSPREAEILDPQHRVLLECAWHALESAGCDPRGFPGRIGVFAGTSLNSYLLFNLMANARAVDSAGSYQTLIASDKDFLATRVSYKLDLRGPSVTVQTACSTSLTAVHLACQSLLDGDCDIALAGGVSVSVPLVGGYRYEPGGILSPDGHCRAFDADAGGTVAGNGVGVVVLRRLTDARDSGDRIAAVIRGTAVNNDGSVKVGYTAPGVDGQAAVIAEALAVADVDPATIGYVETHGTGTVLGDPIEIAALTRAFRERTDRSGFCAIGSVKSNVGHLDAAAGVTALIKATLALTHEAIPATLHHHRPNPQLALETSPFFVNTELRPWPRGGQPRRAGVSSFGIGGTNVHVVLEEGPPPEAGGPSRPLHVLALSGHTSAALAANAGRLAEQLDRHPDTDLDDVAFTLACRRHPFEYRRAVVCREPGEAVAALRRPGFADGTAATAAQVPVAFLFPGQGAQYVDMARGLYGHEPVFAAELDRCVDLFTGYLGEDLRALLFPPPGRADAAGRLAQTAITQPALFAVEYALARLWGAWGVAPRAMLGHSIGEYVAACLAGVFDLADAVRVVAARGRLVQAMPPGAMLAVFLPEPDTARWLGDGLSVAAVNSTALTVVAGPAAAVEDLRHRLAAAGVGCRRLHTSHAFHSPSMDGAVGPLVDELRTVRLNPPRIPFLSNVTGTWITDGEATSAEYWGRQLRHPVRFTEAVEALLADPTVALVEVGPGQTLANVVRQHRAWRGGRTLVATLRHPNDNRADDEYLLNSLADLWSAGVPVDWTGFYAGQDRRPQPLPGYAFQRQRYWVEPEPATAGHEPAGDEPDGPAAAGSVDDWFHTPGWKRLPEPGAGPQPAGGAVWVVLGNELDLGRQLAQRLAAEGATVVPVAAGTDLSHHGDGSWSVDPADRDHLTRLIGALDVGAATAVRFVHLWSLSGAPAGELDEAALDRGRRFGFDSLLALAQGIGDARPPVPAAIDVLCRGVFSVTGDERLQPENAALLGAATVIPQEVPDVTCRVLDLSGTDPADPAGAAVEAVRWVLNRPTGERELALRGRHWWVREFDRIRLATTPDDRIHLRAGGRYLITGGLGGVGLALAEHIARTVQAPVLGLLGRSPLPAEPEWDDWLAGHDEHDPTGTRIRRLRLLQGLGARVVVLRADVTDLAETGRAVAELRRYGPLDGVVHAAGVPSRGLIAGKSRADVDDVLAAKTRGTLVLDRARRDDRPDFILLCSSLTAVLGGPGQSDYAAANAFLDGYAQWKRQTTGAPVCSVAWDTWRGIGMAAGLAARLRAGQPPGEPTGHPLLQRLVHQTEDAQTYATQLSTADSWVVDEHRIMAHGLVPGTTYLELVRAAVAGRAGGRPIELHDVLFTMPVIVPDGQTREIFTTVERDGDRVRFTVRSAAGPGTAVGPAPVWQEHASGWVSFPDEAVEPSRDLDEVARRCTVTEVIDSEDELKRRLKLDVVEQGGRIRFTFGPRWRCLRRVRIGERRLLVTLQLDDAFRADLDRYPLHPALLDVAGAAARIHARDVYYLPLAYRSVRVWAGLTATVHCYVELKESADASGETLTCDMELLDPEGRLLVRVVDFSIKRINDVDGLVDQIQRAAAAPADEPEHGAAPGVLATLGEGMPSEDAVAAFGRLLRAPAVPDHVLVSSRDLATLRRLAGTITPALLAGEVERLAPLGGTHPRPDLATPYTAPRTEAEKAVVAIWQEVLGVDRIGVDDDFFALGGHSLAAVQIGAKIRGHFGVDLDLRGFFDAPTVAHTVAVLTAHTGGGTADSAEDAIPVLSRQRPGDDLDSLDDLDGLDDLSDDEVDARLRELLGEQPTEEASGRGEEGEAAP